MSPSDNRSLKICSLNARSLRNKSAAFVELMNDLKADLFTICETWLSVNDSGILNELTPTGTILYITVHDLAEGVGELHCL